MCYVFEIRYKGIIFGTPSTFIILHTYTIYGVKEKSVEFEFFTIKTSIESENFKLKLICVCVCLFVVFVTDHLTGQILASDGVSH